jgi:2'-5' RNA ligase
MQPNGRQFNNIRAFLAIPLNDELKLNFENLLFAVKKQKDTKIIRWVKSDNLHLTLHFLGQININDINKLINSIRKALSGIKPFNLEFSHIDFFPQNHPHVIAIFTKPNDSLTNLHNLLEEMMLNLQLLPEFRSFHPHITLGRLRYIKKKTSV